VLRENAATTPNLRTEISFHCLRHCNDIHTIIPSARISLNDWNVTARAVVTGEELIPRLSSKMSILLFAAPENAPYV